MQFASLPSGAWYIRQWWIRAARLPTGRLTLSRAEPVRRPVEIHQEGGEVGEVLGLDPSPAGDVTVPPAGDAPVASPPRVAEAPGQPTPGEQPPSGAASLPAVVELDSVAVAAPPGGADVARIHRRDAVEGAELEAARIRGARVVDVIRRFPGITVREGRFDTGTESGTGVCVESSHRLQRLAPPRGSDRGRFCEMVPVYVDGVRVGNAITFLNGLAVDEFESIELVPAAVAATRYGLDAGAAGGALVLTSRRRSRQEP